MILPLELVEMCRSIARAADAYAARVKAEMAPPGLTPPHLLLRVEVRADRETSEWHATYGEVRGMGDTPELACADFDRIWLEGH